MAQSIGPAPLDWQDVELASRPDLVEELLFWRRDAVARAHVAALIADGKSEPADKADVVVSQLHPALYAIRDVEARHWHSTCESCGKPLLNDQPYHAFEDIDGVHVNCDDPNAPTDDPGALIWDDGFSDTQMAEMVARARLVDSDA